MRQDVAPTKQGQFFQKDFSDNLGGLNLVDSVFKVSETQATNGFNFDYVLTGGIRKRLAPTKINSVADAQTYTLGFGLYAPVSGTTKSVFRAAGTKFQLFDTSTPAFTNLTDDTSAAGSNPFTSGTTQDVQFTQFSTGTSDILWGAGGGSSFPVGAYSTTKFTLNGSSPATGSIGEAVNTHNGGSWTAAGTYFYAVVMHKASTGALSNAALDVSATTVNTDDTVTLTLSSITGIDTTKYDQFWIYRSARSGVSGFTTGNLIAKVATSTATFVDKGDLGNPDVLLNQNIPGAGNIVLDNSVLPSGTYNTLALWGHRLVTSSGNSLYISDVNKSESWPLTNYINVPSAGPITALSSISFTAPQANALQELLVIFKERELWVLSPGGNNDYTTWTLLKIDSNAGCPQQSLVVNAQGFLAWVDFRGIHVWDGTSKPIYASRPLEPLFGIGGDIDKTKYNEAVGVFFKRDNQIIWYLSSKTYGEQKFAIKMDIRLTLLKIQQDLTGRTIDGVFVQDKYAFPIYAAMTYIPLNGAQEQQVVGDNAGFCYFAGNGFSDGGSDYEFTYQTPPLHMGDPNTQKLFHKVIVWVQDVGTWNLELDYWADYKVGSAYQTTQVLPISTENASATALWDIAYWDEAFWDAYTPNVVPIIFNLQTGQNNSTAGSALQIQFRNDTANQPITIHGFSVVYSYLGGITA